MCNSSSDLIAGNLDFVAGRVKTGRSRAGCVPPGRPGKGQMDSIGKISVAALAAVAALFASILFASTRARADHKCDPVPEAGWSLVPDEEVISQDDGAPYRAGSDWFVDRVSTVLPYCHYFNSIGNYSLNSYSLAPVVNRERVIICKELPQGASAAVAPYAGPCPPG
jgi:hypothetical protein